MLVCSVDVGTTGAKVCLTDEAGGIPAAAFREYAVSKPREQYAEQAPDTVVAVLLDLIAQVIHKAGVHILDAVVCSVQGDAVIPVDAAGRALHPAILGMDYRSLPQATWCKEELGAENLFRRTGMPPHPLNSITKILWIEQQRPDVAHRTHKYLTYEGFVLKQLGCKGFVTDATMASRSMACGLATGAWDGALLSAMGVNAALLPTIVAPGQVVGNMDKKLAGRLGLKNTPRLVAGGHDQTCAGVGAGAVVEGVGVDSHGTAEVLSTCFGKPVTSGLMLEAGYPCYRHAATGKFFTFALNHTGGLALQWYRDTVASPEKAAAAAGRPPAYDKILDSMPSAPSPLLFLPYLNGSGNPHNDLLARGAFVGLRHSTQRGEMARAVLEALAFEMRLNADRFNKLGFALADIRCVGGGASHPKSMQLKADVMGKPMATLANTQAASRGAAIVGLYALGAFASVQEGVEALVKVDRVYEPDAVKARLYQEQYQAYKELGATLLPFYHRWAQRGECTP